MKMVFFYIIILFLISCHNQNEIDVNQTEDDFEFCDLATYILSDSTINWKLDFDSITSIDDYIIKMRTKCFETHYNVVPFYISDSGYIINLQKLRCYTGGGGYSWDCRAYLKLFIYNDTCYMHWNKGEGNCYYGELESVFSKSHKSNLGNSIIDFWQTNKYMETLKDSLTDKLADNDINNLEIFITPINDKTNDLGLVIENIAVAYLKFQELESKRIFNRNLCDLDTFRLDSLRKMLPLRISISPKLDNERNERIEVMMKK